MVRPADQHIGAESGSHRRFGCCPGIGPGQHAGKAIGVGENAPHHGTAGGETDIDSDPGHGTGIGFRRAVIRLKIAIDVAWRGNDSPTPAEIEHAKVPTCTRRGCASAGIATLTASAAAQMSAAGRPLNAICLLPHTAQPGPYHYYSMRVLF